MKINAKEMTQVELVNYIMMFDNMSKQGYKVEDFNWSVVNISVNEFMEKDENPITRDEWIVWIDKEQEERQVDWGYDSIKQIQDYWLKDPDQEPIIAAWTEDGKIEFWDGFHRFGISVRNELAYVPVILGKITNPVVF